MNAGSADTLIIRDAVPGDAAELAVLLTALGHEATTDEMRRRLHRLQVELVGERVLVAEMSGHVAGLAVLHFTPTLHRATDVARVTALAVDERYHRQGVGRALMAEAERIAREAESIRLEVTSGHDRGPAHDFYREIGFRDEGIRFAKPLT